MKAGSWRFAEATRPAHPCDDAPVLSPLPDRPPPQARAGWLDARVVRNDHDRDRYWRLVLEAPAIARTVQPGQFVMLTPGEPSAATPVLPRPMAVYDADPAAGTIMILYAVVGVGTRLLAAARPGERVASVGPLGRPFDPAERGQAVLLGRGIGICSLTLLGARCAQAGVPVTAISSSRTRQAAIGTDLFLRSGVRVREIYDEDGSSEAGALIQRLHDEFAGTPPTFVAACGSRRLIAAAAGLGREWGSDVQVSVEAPMACGLGYCHGCATGARTATAESPLACRDGPVFTCS